MFLWKNGIQQQNYMVAQPRQENQIQQALNSSNVTIKTKAVLP
jgi:hypothetical protein